MTLAPNSKMSTIPDAERRLQAQIRAHSSWANTEDRAARTANARAALLAKFDAEAGGDPVKAEHLRKVYYKRLALKSAQSRRKSREMTAAADEADRALAEVEGLPIAGDLPDLGGAA